MKDYTIYASVKGCVAITVRADNLTDALKKAEPAMEETDLGNLSDVEWNFHHAEDENGQYLDI